MRTVNVFNFTLCLKKRDNYAHFMCLDSILMDTNTNTFRLRMRMNPARRLIIYIIDNDNYETKSTDYSITISYLNNII